MAKHIIEKEGEKIEISPRFSTNKSFATCLPPLSLAFHFISFFPLHVTKSTCQKSSRAALDFHPLFVRSFIQQNVL